MYDEEWRPVVGQEGRYEVSSLGRVRFVGPRLRNGVPGRVLRPSVMSNGYYGVGVGTRTTRTVHSLVAEAFIGPRPDGCEVNHIDANKLNNALANLEYVTPVGNARHAHRMGRIKTKLTPAAVAEIRALRGKVPQRELERRFGVDHALIGRIQRGLVWAGTT